MTFILFSVLWRACEAVDHLAKNAAKKAVEAFWLNPSSPSLRIDPKILKNPRFEIPTSFCNLTTKGDTLQIYNASLPRSFMRSHKGPSCKYLPFAELNHSSIRHSLIYRHLPKGGSSSVGTLLAGAWNEAWSKHRGPLAAKKMGQAFKHQDVIPCNIPFLEASRHYGVAIEFGVAREPLERFISGYYYTHTNMVIDPSTLKKAIPEVDGGAQRLVEFASSLPDGSNNIHLFPEYFFFCTCNTGPPYGKARAKRPKEACSTPSMSRRSYMLRLETLRDDWAEFIEDATDGVVQQKSKPLPQKNVGKNKPGGNNEAKGFSFFFSALQDEEKPGVTGAICRYLSNDYSVLTAHYNPPLECAHH